MSRNPAKNLANLGPGRTWLHRKARLLPAPPPPSPRAARLSAILGRLRTLLGLTRRPTVRPLPDNLSDHMLRDMGIGPDGREDESSVPFWRRR